MTKNVPAKAESKAVSTALDGSEFFGMETGLENVTARDLLIPRLTILQGLSPQVSRGKPEYDDSAKVGDVYDTGLKERFGDGILFVPVHYMKQWLEWAPRASGKGLQGIHDDESILAQTEKDEKTGQFLLDNGNHIIETHQLYGLNVNADFRKSFIPMASTQIKKAKQLLTWATSEKATNGAGQLFTPPIFFRSYSLTTVPESNNEGSWMGWKVERGPILQTFDNWKAILEDIKSFRDSLARGAVKGDVESMASEGTRAAPAADAPM